MNERMEPTNRLRWVKRLVRWPGDHDRVPVYRSILQQLWRGPIMDEDDERLIVGWREEWRDVPVEEGDA